MPTGQADRLMPTLRRVVLARQSAARSDGDLLGAFVTSRNAFVSHEPGASGSFVGWCGIIDASGPGSASDITCPLGPMEPGLGAGRGSRAGPTAGASNGTPPGIPRRG